MLTSSELIEVAPVQLLVLNYAKGGIGNQLFQHVFGRSLAKKLGATFRTDTTFYGQDPYGFKACVWSLLPDAERAIVAEVTGPGAYVLSEGQIQTLDDVVRLPDDARTLVLSGYWQREALLDPAIVHETYEQLTKQCQAILPAELAARIRTSQNAVAVHLRRRDYAHMGLCKDSYYIAVIDHLLLNFTDAELFVFSDEPNYARHLLGSRGLAFTAVPCGNDMGDLYLMSLCKHFVLANSSYSWWAAYFGESKGGVICCPKEWVTIDGTPSPCPARWMQLSDSVVPFHVNAEEIERFKGDLQKKRFNTAINGWFGDRGDRTVRVVFDDLDKHSVVFDLGGYQGDWTAEISSRYGAKIYVFEPVKAFYAQICKRFENAPQIQPFQFGLGMRSETMDLHHSADGTGAFVGGGSYETVNIVEAHGFFQMQGVDRIDLMKINIEGGEYDLLEHLIASADIEKIGRLQVQFHDFVPNAIAKRARIVNALAKTHRQTWCYYFVWEEWERLPATN
jgi:FkbM family methyltransferase